MTTEETTGAPAGERGKVVLAYASLLALAVKQALRESGSTTDPGRLAELESQWADGSAGLAAYIQIRGDQIYLVATAVPGAPIQDPWKDENALRILGPMVLSRDQLEALGAPVQAPRRSAMN